MPKRVVDGESLWGSRKLLQVQPPWIKAEFANLIPLALANGTFECDSRLVWRNVYAYNRPEITPENVEGILAEFERVKLLFRWTDETGKQWGYWVGIEKPGRLPSAARLRERHEKEGAPVPKEQLAGFLGQPIGNQRDSIGKPEGSLGFGSGSGSGSGSDKTSSSKVKSTSDQEKGSESALIGNAKKKTQPSHEAERLSALLQREIQRNKPDYRITPAQLRKWAVTADRMIRLDGRTEERIASNIRWAQQDEFWMANILSMDKLREKFDQLEMRRQASSKGNGHAHATSLPAAPEGPTGTGKLRAQMIADGCTPTF